MVARADILAGRAVILINIQDTIDAQLRSIRSKLRVFSNSLKEIGGDLFRGGLAGTIASAFPVKEFITFQDQMLFLQTKSQATTKQMESMEKVIRQLGKTTSFSSQEVARGATMLAQAGFTPLQIEGSLQSVLDLARGARIELETSSTILANIMSAYRIDAANSGQVASKLIAASRLGTLDVVDLGESLKESLTTFRQLGIPLDAALGMIAQISNMSLRATKAGTSLNAAFAQMSSKKEQLAEIGVVVEQMDLDNPVRFFAKLSTALAKFDRQTQVSTLQSLFAIRGGRGVGAVILQDLDELQAKINTIAKAGDEARISAMKLDSQLGGVWRRGVSAFQELNIAIGATSEGPLTVFGERLTKILNDLNRLSQANPKVTQTLLLMGPAALVSGVAILGLTMILGKLAMLITPIMMLNSALWGTAAAIVGVHKRALMGGATWIATPYITGRQAIEAHNKALEKLAQKSTKARQAAVIKTAAALPFWAKSTSLPAIPKLSSGLALVRKRYEALGTTAAKTATQVALVTSKAFPGGSRGLNQALTPRNFSLPLLVSEFKLDPKGVKLPTLAETFNRVGKGKQLVLPLQFALDFGSGDRLKPADFLKPGLANYQFNAEAEKVISSITQKIIGGKTARRELGRSGEFSKELNKRLSSVLRKVEVPKELIPRILKDVTDQVERTNIKPNRKLVQRMFDFEDAPANVVQKMFAFEDVPQQMQKQFEIGRKKIIGRGASFAPGFAVEKLGTPNTMAARQAAADLQNAAIAASRKAPKRNPFAWLRPLITDIKLLLPSSKPFLAFFSGIGKGMGAMTRGVLSVNWLGKITSTFKGLWTVFKGIFTVLNGIRRFVFSLSGALLIVEALILFGDKIPGISQLLEGAGKAFRGLFSDIGRTLSNLGPSFSLMRRGFSDVFGGEAERGVNRIKLALSDMANILRTGLYSAWVNFQKAIEPAAERIKAVFQGLLGVFDAIIAVIGTNLSAIFDSGAILIKGDGTLLETIKSAFSTENIRGFFGMLIEAIGSVGQQLNIMIGAIAEVLNGVKLAFVAMLKSMSWIPGSGANEALNELDANAARRKELEDDLFTLRQIYEKEKANQTSHALTEYQKLVNAEILKVMAELERLGPAFGTIAYNTEQRGRELANSIASISRRFMPQSTIPLSPEKAAAVARNAAFMGQFNDVRDRLTNAYTEMLQSAQDEIIANLKGLQDLIPERAKQFWNDFREGFMRKAVEQQAAEINREGLGKALVGDIASTRGNLLQKVPRLEKLQEQANKHLDNIEDDMAFIRNKPGMAFG